MRGFFEAGPRSMAGKLFADLTAAENNRDNRASRFDALGSGCELGILEDD